MSVEMFSVGDARIEAVVEGRGDTLVFLPGVGMDVTRFQQLSTVLSQAGFRTVAVNARGVGRSTGPLEGLTLHDLAADVAGVIGALAASPAYVLGQAFGNRLARCLAADRPDLVRTVILLAAGGLAQPDPEAAAAMRDLQRPGISDREWQEFARLSIFSPRSDPGLVLRSRDLYRVWPEALGSQRAADQATPLEEWWAGGNAPMLVIQGLDDRIAPPANGRALRDEFGERVQLVELPNAGHAMLLEQPEAVADAVLSYLRAH